MSGERFDIPYAGPDSDPAFQVLDVFPAPEGTRTPAPVILFIHGGAFHMSDKRDARYYPDTGERLAGEGFLAVLPNYRLSPQARYPEHVRDVAAALAWVVRQAGDLGGDPDRIYVAGHSAGGFLAAAVALDATFLADHALDHGCIRGVIPVCGKFEVTDPGADGTFGEDPGEWHRFAPLTHVRAQAPPFLILEAEEDDWWAPGEAERFHDALRAAGGTSRLLELPGDHYSLVTGMGQPDDRVLRLIREFVEQTS